MNRNKPKGNLTLRIQLFSTYSLFGISVVWLTSSVSHILCWVSVGGISMRIHDGHPRSFGGNHTKGTCMQVFGSVLLSTSTVVKKKIYESSMGNENMAYTISMKLQFRLVFLNISPLYCDCFVNLLAGGLHRCCWLTPDTWHLFFSLAELSG